MNIDLAVEKKLILSVEEVSALRLMLRVDMSYKSQITIAAACKTCVEKVGQTPEHAERVTDAAGQSAMEAVSNHLDTYLMLDRPLVRAMEMAGYATPNASDLNSKVAVFLSSPLFDGIRNVVLTGVYNAMKIVAANGESNEGVLLGQTLMRCRSRIIEAFEGAEVPAQDASGVFTFTQPAPRGTIYN